MPNYETQVKNTTYHLFPSSTVLLKEFLLKELFLSFITQLIWTINTIFFEFLLEKLPIFIIFSIIVLVWSYPFGTDQGNHGKWAAYPAKIGQQLSLNAGTIVALIESRSSEVAGSPRWTIAVELNKNQVPTGPSTTLDDPSSNLISVEPLFLSTGFK